MKATHLVVAICLLAPSIVDAGGQQALPTAAPGWVGLYNDGLIEWLENENRLDEICDQFNGQAKELDRCRAEKLEPRSFVVPLYADATRAVSRGALLVVAIPGKGLRFFYARPEGGESIAFDPDLNLQDWGYGPYFHQTYLDRHGDWFLLPQEPFPAVTWMNARDFGEEAHVLEVGGIVESPHGMIVILAIEPDAVRARPEQPADMWCEAGDPPPLEPWQELRIPMRSLYSPTGHLLLSPAYMKGC